MGQTIDVIYKYDIYVKNHRCHIKIRYLWGKQVGSKNVMGKQLDKNTISMDKTIDVLKDIDGKNHWCHIKIRYLCEKPSMSY